MARVPCVTRGGSVCTQRPRVALVLRTGERGDRRASKGKGGLRHAELSPLPFLLAVPLSVWSPLGGPGLSVTLAVSRLAVGVQMTEGWWEPRFENGQKRD